MSEHAHSNNLKYTWPQINNERPYQRTNSIFPTHTVDSTPANPISTWYLMSYTNTKDAG